MKRWQHQKIQKPHYRRSYSDPNLKDFGFNDTIDEFPYFFDSSHIVWEWGNVYYNGSGMNEYQKFLMLKGHTDRSLFAKVSVTFLIEPTVAWNWGMETNLSPQLIAAYITKVINFP